MSTELKSVTPESPATELPELTQDHVKGLDMALQYRDERLQSTYLCREVQSVVSALSSRTHGIYKIPEEVVFRRDAIERAAKMCAVLADGKREDTVVFSRLYDWFNAALSCTPEHPCDLCLEARKEFAPAGVASPIPAPASEPTKENERKYTIDDARRRASSPSGALSEWPRDRDGNYPCESMTDEEIHGLCGEPWMPDTVAQMFCRLPKGHTGKHDAMVLTPSGAPSATSEAQCSPEAEDIIAQYGGAQFLAGQTKGSARNYGRDVDELRDTLEAFVGSLESQLSAALREREFSDDARFRQVKIITDLRARLSAMEKVVEAARPVVNECLAISANPRFPIPASLDALAEALKRHDTTQSSEATSGELAMEMREPFRIHARASLSQDTSPRSPKPETIDGNR